MTMEELLKFVHVCESYEAYLICVPVFFLRHSVEVHATMPRFIHRIVFGALARHAAVFSAQKCIRGHGIRRCRGYVYPFCPEMFRKERTPVCLTFCCRVLPPVRSPTSVRYRRRSNIVYDTGSWSSRSSNHPKDIRPTWPVVSSVHVIVWRLSGLEMFCFLVINNTAL